MAQVVLASQNAHKLEELRDWLPELEPLAADDYPPETGQTYEANARIKAQFARTRAPADAWVLGEDSGIECDALDGAPGVHSARWAQGDQADALLERLAQENDRRAHMITEIVAISPAGEEVHVRGELDGTLTRQKRGTTGFGYDPVFVPDGYDQTVAELGEEWKKLNSHRGRAAQALLAALRTAGAS